LKFWIDGTVLLELLAKGEADRYIKTFGAAGIASLDRELRDLEVRLADVLLQRFPPNMLADAFGADWRELPTGEMTLSAQPRPSQ
jgi:hypothetical protein